MIKNKHLKIYLQDKPQMLKPKRVVAKANLMIRFLLEKLQSLPSLLSMECYQQMPMLELIPDSNITLVCECSFLTKVLMLPIR